MPNRKLGGINILIIVRGMLCYRKSLFYELSEQSKLDEASKHPLSNLQSFFFYLQKTREVTTTQDYGTTTNRQLIYEWPLTLLH